MAPRTATPGWWERLFAPVGLIGSYCWTRLLGLGKQTGLQVGPLLPKGSEDYPGAPTSGWEHPVAFPSISAFQLGSSLAASMACSRGERPAEGAIILQSQKAETQRGGQGHLCRSGCADVLLGQPSEGIPGARGKAWETAF